MISVIISITLFIHFNSISNKVSYFNLYTITNISIIKLNTTTSTVLV